MVAHWYFWLIILWKTYTPARFRIATALPAFCFQSSLRLQCGTMELTYLFCCFWNQDLMQYSLMNVFLKGHTNLKGFFQAEFFSKKWMNKFAFTTSRLVFVRFLEHCKKYVCHFLISSEPRWVLVQKLVVDH